MNKLIDYNRLCIDQKVGTPSDSRLRPFRSVTFKFFVE